MTEHEWLSSDNPAPMVEYLFRTVFVHDQQKWLHLILTNTGCGVWGHKHRNVIADMTLADWISHAIICSGQPESKMAEHAGVIRDIVGNPFRPHRFVCPNCKTGGMLNMFELPSMYCGWCKWSGIVKWLTNDVLNIARTIREGETDCKRCDGTQRLLNNQLPSGWQYCPFCKDKLKTPRFNDMPILADALEEAGCTEEELLRHLRRQERCPRCLGEGRMRPPGWDGVDKDAWIICNECPMVTNVTGVFRGNGWIPLRREHVKDCWALKICGP